MQCLWCGDDARPRVLPCGHAYCARCVLSLQESAQASGIAATCCGVRIDLAAALPLPDEPPDVIEILDDEDEPGVPMQMQMQMAAMHPRMAARRGRRGNGKARLLRPPPPAHNDVIDLTLSDSEPDDELLEQIARFAKAPAKRKATRQPARASKRRAGANAAASVQAIPVDQGPAECTACMDSITATDERMTGPCGHVYCVPCIERLAKSSLLDRSLVPIQCCGTEFPLEFANRVLSNSEMTTYNRFLTERDWKNSDLKSDKEYAAAVKESNGRQCPRCGMGLHKITGCDWVTCNCGLGFCWKCGVSDCACYSTRAHNAARLINPLVPNMFEALHPPGDALFARIHARIVERNRQLIQDDLALHAPNIPPLRELLQPAPLLVQDPIVPPIPQRRVPVRHVPEHAPRRARAPPRQRARR